MRRWVPAVLAGAVILAAVTAKAPWRSSQSPSPGIGAPGAEVSPHDDGVAATAAVAFSATCAGDATVWAARYSVGLVGDEATVRLLSVTKGAEAVDTSEFTASWTDPDGQAQQGSAELLTSSGVAGTDVRLVTPDGTCALFLRNDGPPAVHGVSVVGDSVIDGLGLALSKPDSRSAAQRSWTVTGAPGEAWAPLAGTAGAGALPLIRGVVAEDPNVLVMSFGTNDALHALFAQATGGDSMAEAMRRATTSSIATALRDVAASVPCVLLVTPTNWPTPMFGAGIDYSWEARSVVDELRGLASRSADQVVAMVDWADRSLTHHRPDSTVGDWFPDGDEVHPNAAGLAALGDLIATTIQSQCPSAAATRAS